MRCIRMKQQTISDVKYNARKRITNREEFPEIMDKIIPWEEWVVYRTVLSERKTQSSSEGY